MAEQVTGRGVHGVVAAAAPLAAQAGAAALRAGGNAFDAAVAAALAETVLLPPKCGFGGDLIALVLPADGSAPEALLAIGAAAAGHAAVAEAGRWRDVGPDAVGPPAAAAGHAALAERGVLGRDVLAQWAIALAEDGAPWADVCTRLSAQAASLVAEMHPEGCVYFPDGRPIAPASLVRLPGLAEVLREWVQRGAGLLQGPVGSAIVRAVAERGGALRDDDLALARAEWAPAAHLAVGGRSVWATPAPTHGPSLLGTVAELADDLAAAGTGTGLGPVAVHRAVMAAIERQRRELGDPGGTSMVSAGDAAGNVVVIVHSNSYPRFGSGIVVPEYSLVLANRAGRGFTPEPGHPNFPVHGRRPATTLHAWAVADTDGVPRFAGGTPGGANQLPWNAQSLARLLGGEERPGVLVTSPLWEWLPDDDGLRLEGGFATDDVAALTAVAPRVVAAPRWGCKSAQQVVRRPRAGEVWEAAADPRTVGLALGV
jgi:gamma-glutamyltranspeptidase/glutathione hydrolase